MDKNIFHEEIEILLRRIGERHASMKASGKPIPKIEVDILLNDLRSLYEFCSELGTFSAFHSLPLEVKTEKIVSEPEPLSETVIPPAIHETFSIESEIITTPVFEEKKVSYEQASIRKTNSSPTNLFDDAPTLAETFEGKVSTVNDRIIEQTETESVATSIKKKPIADLRASIGINEKFIFLNELFESNAIEYAEAIDRINACSTESEADEYLRNGFASKYNWKLKNKFVRSDFMDLVRRRFL